MVGKRKRMVSSTQLFLFCFGLGICLTIVVPLLFYWWWPFAKDPSLLSAISTDATSKKLLETSDTSSKVTLAPEHSFSQEEVASFRSAINSRIDSGNANVAVVSLSIATGERVLVSEWNHWLYAKMHGYNYICNHKNEDFGDSRYPKLAKAHFQKPAIIRRLLNDRRPDGNYSLDFLLWIDSDALFIDCKRTVAQIWESAIEKYGADDDSADDICIILSGGKNAGINSGVILFRNCAFTRQFVDIWYRVSNVFTVKNRFTLLRYNDQSTLALALAGVSEIDLVFENESDSEFRKRMEQLTKEFELPVLKAKSNGKSKVNQIRNKYFVTGIREHILLADYTHMNTHGKTYEENVKNGRRNDFIVHLPGIVFKDKNQALRNFSLDSTCLKLFLDSTSVQ